MRNILIGIVLGAILSSGAFAFYNHEAKQDAKIDSIVHFLSEAAR